jgi:hypothetical protein
VSRAEQNVHVRLLQRIAAELRKPLGEVAGAPSSLRALADLVYATYYLGETSAATQARFRDTVTAIVLREDPVFGAALREANRGAGFTQEGWRVVGPRDGGLVVRRDRISLLLRDGDAAACSDDGQVAVRFPNERPYAYPDYYVAIGNGGPPPSGSAAPLIRLYFNVTPSGATRLLSAVTSTMGATLRRFAIKILNHPASYGRPDAAVALVPRDDIGRALALLPGVLRDTGPHLDEAVPAFTLRLCRGVAIAEDPAVEGAPRSFGQHRAFVVAKGLTRAFEEGAGDAEARLACVVRELAAADIDPARPYCARASLQAFHAEIDRHMAALEDTINDYREHAESHVAAQAGGSEGACGTQPPRLRPSRERLGARRA